MKNSLLRISLVAITILALFSACTTGPGAGGKASIQGKVHMTNRWSAACTELAQPFANFYAGDVDVYIIYGDDPSYGDRVKTGPDGTFWFKYLRPGKYTVYAFSKDCNAADGSESEVIKLECEITDKNQVLITEDLELEK
jgi:hypothetical protein